MTWGIVAVAGASLVGGALASNGAKSAANTQANAANNATQAQQAMFDKTVDMESPFRQEGADANQKLSNLLGIDTSGQQTQDNFDAKAYLAANPDVAKDRYYATNPYQHYLDYGKNEGRQFTYAQGTGPGSAPSDPSTFGSLMKPFGMSDFQMDPGIQFQMKYGQQALQNSQAAQNGVLSGGALKDLIGFNQDYAGKGYQSAFDRYMANKNFTIDSLSNLANRGQAAAGNTVNNAGQFSSGMAGTITGAGNASAAGTVGSANAISGGLSNAAGSYFLSSMLKPQSTATDGYGQFGNSPMASTIYSNGSLGD